MDHKHKKQVPHSLALGAGLLAVGGFYMYLLSITSHDDAVTNAHCAQIDYCHVGGIETGLFFTLPCAQQSTCIKSPP